MYGEDSHWRKWSSPGDCAASRAITDRYYSKYRAGSGAAGRWPPR